MEKGAVTEENSGYLIVYNRSFKMEPTKLESLITNGPRAVNYIISLNHAVFRTACTGFRQYTTLGNLRNFE